MKRILLLFFVSPLLALKYDPWFGNLMEFNLKPYYLLQYYPDVEGAVNPTSYHSLNNFLGSDLYVRFLPEWEGLLEAEWNTTKMHNMRFLSTAAQGRYLVLDDIEGDFASFVLLGDIRYVPTHALRDVSTPYSGEFNMEVGFSLGKEFDFGNEWSHLVYASGLIGQANRGVPWFYTIADYSAVYMNEHTLGINAIGYFGLGNKQVVDINNFKGYAKINHQSIDLSLHYSYSWKVWGTFRAEAGYRVFAKRYPEKATQLLLSYTLPFSLL